MPLLRDASSVFERCSSATSSAGGLRGGLHASEATGYLTCGVGPYGSCPWPAAPRPRTSDSLEAAEQAGPAADVTRGSSSGYLSDVPSSRSAAKIVHCTPWRSAAPASAVSSAYLQTQPPARSAYNVPTVFCSGPFLVPCGDSFAAQATAQAQAQLAHSQAQAQLAHAQAQAQLAHAQAQAQLALALALTAGPRVAFGMTQAQLAQPLAAVAQPLAQLAGGFVALPCPCPHTARSSVVAAPAQPPTHSMLTCHAAPAAGGACACASCRGPLGPRSEPLGSLLLLRSQSASHQRLQPAAPLGLALAVPFPFGPVASLQPSWIQAMPTGLPLAQPQPQALALALAADPSAAGLCRPAASAALLPRTSGRRRPASEMLDGGLLPAAASAGTSLSRLGRPAQTQAQACAAGPLVAAPQRPLFGGSLGGAEEWIAQCSLALGLAEPDTLRLALHCWRRVAPLRGLPAGGSGGGRSLYAAACLWVAVKLEEKRRSAPGGGVIAALAGTSGTELCAAELTVMGWLQWRPYEGYRLDESHLLVYM
ncbi:hypothetical protein HYH03_009892 [Edaphochlamys debaryana]|uniref:Uncharacterized protein n=1 Tax=Edaphochlamys debaryana TaxID=47281 RepID=A0A835XXQ5_9CHLO|nr:hypothetical protein HYH03_009892 [Edaphochlamys debaryana]|eukprot:KAG2491729.1 hypothetical protein HYH03_009892 [Edaphochlamys debaryana]